MTEEKRKELEYELLSKQMDDLFAKGDENYMDIDGILAIADRMNELKPVNQDNNITKEEMARRISEEIVPKHYKTVVWKRFKLRAQNKLHQSKNYFRFAAVGISCLFLANFTTEIVAGNGLLNTIISWTEYQFRKSTSGSGEVILQNEHHLEHISDVNINLPKLEDKYDIIDINISESSHSTKIDYMLKLNNQEYISYVVEIPHIIVPSETIIEKINTEVMIIPFNNTEVYIIENVAWYIATWIEDSIDYTVSGFKDVDSIMEFLDSLEKRKGETIL